MGSKANYLENEILDHIFGKGAYTPPTIYVALYTVTPSDSAPGTEVSGGSYARKATVAGNWNVAASGATANGAELAFVTATGDWGTVVAFALMDAVSGGNMLYWGAVTPNKDIDNGDTARFAAGELDITED